MPHQDPPSTLYGAPHWGTDFTAGDWAHLGFRCGLEIHQQLLTERKLFCRCPAGRYSDHYDAEVLRHMRPTLSEMGEYDGTALMEFKTRKEIVYRLNRDSVCTYEMDDTPPFEINQRAVDIAMEVALLCGCSLVGELHVIRKQYLDGSIPAGFQRTAIVGVDGALPFLGRTLHIRQVSVEEDACREVSDEGHRITFLTDRLSMPLVEVVTEPELLTPWEAGAAAQLIGDLMRTTGKVRRGHGATRQDVNVSVTGSTRVEIKGVPRIKMIPPLVRIEALRQRALLDIRDRLADEPSRTHTHLVRSVDDLITEAQSGPLQESIGAGGVVRAIRVPGGQAVLHTPTQPGHTFLDELAGRVRVIACLDTKPNLLTPPNGGQLSGRAWHRIRRRVRARGGDAVVLAWGPERDVATALDEVRIRFEEARQGVPNETRQAHTDGTTDFERILPGPDRMYPDTDSPPLSITDARIERLRDGLPRPPWERMDRLEAGGIPAHLRRRLALSPRCRLIVDLLDRGFPGALVGHVLGDLLTALERQGHPTAAIPDATLATLVKAVADDRIPRESLTSILRVLGRAHREEAEPATVTEVARQLGITPLDRPLAEEVGQQLAALSPPKTLDPPARWRYVMGALMRNLRGRVPGRTVAQELGHIEPTLRAPVGRGDDPRLGLGPGKEGPHGK